MSTYRKEWPCCGDVTETDAWEPESCPFCASPAAAVPEGALPPLPTSQIYVRVWESMKEPGESLQLASQPYFTGEQMQAYARAAVEADRAQRRPRVQISPEMKAAIDKAHETGSTIAESPHGIAFINYGHDYGDNAHLECTACGGSGHIEDQRAIAAADRAQQGEPVYQFSTGKDSWLDCDKTFYDNCLKYNYARRIVYLAAPVPDTGIPTAGEVDDRLANVLHTLQITNNWDSLNKAQVIARIREVDAELASRCRAQGGNTSDIGNPISDRSPISTTPTSGEVEKAEAVAWALVSPKGGIKKVAITRASVESRMARWLEEWPGNTPRIRPLIYGDAAVAPAHPGEGEKPCN